MSEQLITPLYRNSSQTDIVCPSDILQPKSMALRTKEPADTDSLGCIVWHILGGRNIRAAESTQRLSIRLTALTAVVHGRWKILPATMEKKRWRAVFAAYYPDTWIQYQADFERHISLSTALVQLRAKTKKQVVGVKPKNRGSLLRQKCGVKSREPNDKESFGHVLWLILGGENPNITVAARRLGVRRNVLGSIIHDLRNASEQLLLDKRWRETLAQYYPDGWLEHSQAFEERLVQSNQRLEVSIEDWRKAVGEFTSGFLNEKNDTIADIVGDIEYHVLQKPSIWDRVVNGDKHLPISIYRAALEEICRLYHLGGDRPCGHYAEVKRLMAQHI